jgi:site-specific DNA-methyltransferase (adenine-specific)
MTTASIGNATLFLADCRDILPSLGMVDVTITDPPYSADTHKGARTIRQPHQSPIDFPHFTLEEFLSSARSLVEMTRRWVVMTCDFRHAGKLEECGLPLIRPGVWVKPNGAPQFSGDRPGMGFESVAILHRPGKKFWNGGGHHAVWVVPRTEGEHPAEKPLALISEWVRLFSEPGETVLDPFMGSGTTGVACLKLGRRFIGIDIEERYFDLSRRRIERAYREPDLFRDMKAPLEQRSLFDEWPTAPT